MAGSMAKNKSTQILKAAERSRVWGARSGVGIRLACFWLTRAAHLIH